MRELTKKERKVLYEDLCYRLWNYQCFEYVSPIEAFEDYDLIALKKGIPIISEVSIHTEAIEQECHALTAYAWLKDRNLKIHSGLGYSEHLDGWYAHSFSTNEKGKIIEPTPLIRDLYFGAPLSNKRTLKMVLAELPNIKRIGLNLKNNINIENLQLSL